MVRSIEVVKDLDAQNPEFVFLSSDSLLDPLSSPKLSKFRRQLELRYQRGQPRLRCAKCEMPIHVSVAGATAPESRDGRDAYFAHYPDTDHLCEWRTRNSSSGSLEEEESHGTLESPIHRDLTKTFVRMLSEDLAFDCVQLRPVISKSNGWRRPDVSTVLGGQLTAFDFQINNTRLPDMLAREGFYLTHGIRYLWLSGGSSPHELARQPSQDIYWNNECQILAIDDEVSRITIARKLLHLSVWIVVPELNENGLCAKWKRTIQPRTNIDWDSPLGGQRLEQPSFETAADRLVKDQFKIPILALLGALNRSDSSAEKDAGSAWNEIASAVGSPRWDTARLDEAFRAFGILASAAAGKKMDASRYPENQLTAMFNNFLEHDRYRGWTAALEQIAASYNHDELLSRDSTRRKISRNLGESHPDFRLKYRAMLDIVFPRSALSRLSGPPSSVVGVP